MNILLPIIFYTTVHCVLLAFPVFVCTLADRSDVILALVLCTGR